MYVLMGLASQAKRRRECFSSGLLKQQMDWAWQKPGRETWEERRWVGVSRAAAWLEGRDSAAAWKWAVASRADWPAEARTDPTEPGLRAGWRRRR